MGNTTRYRHGLGPYVDAALSGVLPAIRGRWFGVDPGGTTIGTAPRSMGLAAVYTNLTDAYNACKDGVGDGIVFFSSVVSGTTYSSAMLAPLTWSKSCITVVSTSAGGYNGRARIASHAALTSAVSVVSTATTQTIVRADGGSFITDGWKVGMTGIFDVANAGNASRTFTVTAVAALTLTCTAGDILLEGATSRTLCGYFSYLIDVSGSDNRFVGLYFINEASHVLNVGAISVSGARNRFDNCHFNTVGALQSADAGLFDVRVSASENHFYDCWFGNNNTLRSAASGNILLGLSTTSIGQDFFTDCYILSISVTNGHGGIKLADAATLDGWVQFKRCSFVNWASGALTTLTTLVVGATENNCGILLQDCAVVGWAAITLTGVHKVFTSNATGAAGIGGLAGTLS